MKQKQIGIYIGIIFSMTLWGMSFVWTNQLLRVGLPMYSLLVARLLISVALLIIVAMLGKQFVMPQRRDIKWFLLMVFFEPFLYFIGETYGIKLTDSANISSIIISTLPVFAIITAYLIYKEKLTKTNVFGVFFALIGVVICLLNDEMAFGVRPLGLAMLLLAIFSANGYGLVIKKLSHKYNPITIVIVQNLLGALFFMPFLSFETTQLANFQFSFTNTYPLFLLAVFPSTLAFLTYIKAVKHIGVAKASMFCTLIPIITLLFSGLIGQEILTLRNILGALIVVFGLMLSQMKKKIVRGG